MAAQLQFGLGMGRSAYSGRRCEAGRPIPTARRGVWCPSAPLLSSACGRSGRRDRAGIGCEIAQRILTHAPADAARPLTTRTCGRPGSGRRRVRGSGRGRWVTSECRNWRTDSCRWWRRRWVAPGGRDSRTAGARDGRPPTGYTSGPSDPRRVMAQAPLSIATRQPYRTGLGRATGIPRVGSRRRVLAVMCRHCPGGVRAVPRRRP